MQLKIISSSSAGNAYILENEKEALLIECGVRFDRIKQALNFKLYKVVACLVTHEHGDHCKSVKDVLAAGIKVYASAGTHKEMGTASHHRSAFTNGMMAAGGFQFKAFDVKHDAEDPVGFIIKHAECGNVLFLTDTYYCEYTFPGMNNIIVEANHCKHLVKEGLEQERIHKKHAQRLLTSHMSIDTCIDLLRANDLRNVNNIVLIHLSNDNSDAESFRKRVQQATGKTVHVADTNQVIDFNKSPF
jgi:phosphoribosyl 1,2-cyclic phosphodiesterase